MLFVDKSAVYKEIKESILSPLFSTLGCLIYCLREMWHVELVFDKEFIFLCAGSIGGVTIFDYKVRVPKY